MDLTALAIFSQALKHQLHVSWNAAVTTPVNEVWPLASQTHQRQHENAYGHHSYPLFLPQNFS
jgi:hypothetical protein